MGDVAAGSPPFRGQVGHPEGATLDSCLRMGWLITGTCTEHGDHTLVPDPARHRRWLMRRLWLLFAEGRLTCVACRKPFYGLHLAQGKSGNALAMWSRHDPAIRAHAASRSGDRV